MYIKRYTIATLIFIILVGWYVYAFVSQDSLSIEFFGINSPTVSVALWVVTPLILLYLASIIHMFVYSFIGSMKLRKYEKDYEKLIDTISDAYLAKENRNNNFKTPRYQLLGSLIDNTKFFTNENINADTSNEKINRVLKLMEDVKSGEVVELKKYELSSNNALVIQNDRNRYKKGDISSEDVLTHFSKYDRSLCEEAYLDFVKISPFYAIEKYKEFLTKKSLFEVLTRVNSNENTLEVSNESLISLFETLDLNTKDYLDISTILSTHMIPEQRIKLFATLSELKEETVEAYLYTLFDLEMLAPADEILENSQPEEYLKFKSYRALKECNKHYNINLFI